MMQKDLEHMKPTDNTMKPCSHVISMNDNDLNASE